MAKLVSRTYGDALFQLAVEENRIDTMFEEVRTVAVALQENPDLTRLMNHPKIDKEEKVKLIEDIFKGQVEDELVGLMRMIVEKDHYNEIESVFTYFMEQVKEYKNIGTAYVTSAMELSDAQKQEAVDSMVRMTDIAEKEAAAEVLLQAKGFQEAVVSINGDAVDVVVNAAELTDVQRAQIEDIVKRKTEIAAENIVISTIAQ